MGLGGSFLHRVSRLNRPALLGQYFLNCPGCGQAAAVHVSYDGSGPGIVRVVCASGCPDDDALRMRVIDALCPVAVVA